jgi:hypothetical protein
MKQLSFFSSSLFIFLCGTYSIFLPSENEIATANKDYPTSLVSLNDFQNLATEIEKHRAERLISLDSFIDLSKKENTIILDTRSKVRFDRKHLAGAIHLAFTEFSQSNLEKLIPDSDTRILIYCNNNFEGDQIDFRSKVAAPEKTAMINSNGNPVMLALNIPTYLNLYGYGYKNVYELHELVHVDDQRAKFEGSALQNFPQKNMIQQIKSKTQIRRYN